MQQKDTPESPQDTSKEGPEGRARSEGNVFQVDGGWTYTIYIGADTSGTLLAFVVASGAANLTIKTDPEGRNYTAAEYTENWYVNTGALASVSGATSLYVATSSLPTNKTVVLPALFTSATPSFTSPEAATWTTTAPTTSSSTYYFSGTDAISSRPLVIQLVPQSAALAGVAWYLAIGTAPAAVRPSGGYAVASGPPTSFYVATSIWPRT